MPKQKERHIRGSGNQGKGRTDRERNQGCQNRKGLEKKKPVGPHKRHRRGLPVSKECGGASDKEGENPGGRTRKGLRRSDKNPAGHFT